MRYKNRVARVRELVKQHFFLKLLTAGPVLIKTNCGILARNHKKPRDKMPIFSGSPSFLGHLVFATAFHILCEQALHACRSRESSRERRSRK